MKVREGGVQCHRYDGRNNELKFQRLLRHRPV
jgi:hypothetical protein